MNHDDPKLTAYALGEGDEALELDGQSAKIVEETALVASVLREHFRRPKRRRRVMRYAVAASLLIVGFAVFILSYRPSHQTVAVAPVRQPIVQVQASGAPILRLTPTLAESAQSSSLTNANFRGVLSLDVDQLVAVVIQDASRVGSFTSLRLMPESAVVYQ